MWCNHTAEKILGYGREHMIGQDIRDFQTTGAGDSISAKVQIRDTCSIKYQVSKVFIGSVKKTFLYHPPSLYSCISPEQNIMLKCQ